MPIKQLLPAGRDSEGPSLEDGPPLALSEALPALTGCQRGLAYPPSLKQGLVSEDLPPRGVPSSWDER